MIVQKKKEILRTGWVRRFQAGMERRGWYEERRKKKRKSRVCVLKKL